MPRRVFVALVLISALLPAQSRASAVCGWASASITDAGITLRNGCVTRIWETRSSVRTTAIRDERTGFQSEPADDFALVLDALRIPSSSLVVERVSASAIPGGARVSWLLLRPGVVEVSRSLDLYDGVAGFAAQTSIRSLAPLALSGYTLDQIFVGIATPSISEFRAGSDWREPGWNPPSIGNAHTGDWRETHTAARGSALTATGEWSSAETNGEHVAIVNERRDYASSVGTYENGVLSAGVDFSRDVIYLGPFEESGHIENPGPGPARHKLLEPNVTLDLERSFTALGRDGDDEAWQYSKYLTQHRLAPYPKRVTFNSDKVDRDAISTGAKDDMNYERFLKILPAAREMGVDTFVFDDGWMARSGDWCPDSPQCPEPRWDGQPGSKFAPRFPDDTFAAVRKALAGGPGRADDIQLGLWMNPMSYNPASNAFRMNPQWSCAPVGTATGAANAADPESGSNEAGIGLWNPRALGVDPDTGAPVRMIDYLEGRIRRAIETYGARYFKFDFLVWVDCAGAWPVTMYEYHDEFVGMLDRVMRSHPEVTFQIDDTNDHRMFPFETISRGPSWYLNGGPSISQTLHTVWNLAPFVPGSALGLRSLSSSDRATYGIDASMAAAITSHLTFSFPVDDELTAVQRAQIRRWTDFYKENRATLTGFEYPLLGDPAEGKWTALQPWNRDRQSGWVLAYRQTDSSTSVNVPLRGLDAGSYRATLMDPATGTQSFLGVFTASTLRTTGLPLSAAAPGGYAIARILRA